MVNTPKDFEEWLWGECREWLQERILTIANNMDCEADVEGDHYDWISELEDNWENAIEQVLDLDLNKPMWREFRGMFDDWAAAYTRAEVEFRDSLRERHQ